eukprot:6189290-Pleurochrysis_carterae.AAC.1
MRGSLRPSAIKTPLISKAYSQRQGHQAEALACGESKPALATRQAVWIRATWYSVQSRRRVCRLSVRVERHGEETRVTNLAKMMRKSKASAALSRMWVSSTEPLCEYVRVEGAGLLSG